MTTTTDILTLTQWLSPGFPIGTFAYSHGLEAAVEDGTLLDAQDLQEWLHDLLTTGSARSDAVLLSAAYDTPDDLTDIDAEARAFAASKERLMETDLQGAAFTETLSATSDITLPRLTYPVAIGAAACAKHIDKTLTLALYLQAFTANLTAAALRLLPMGQVDGQHIQTALKHTCETTAQTLQHATLDDLYTNTFASDIAAMRHETQYSRIFRS